MHTDQVAELTREGVAQIVESFRCKPPALGEPFANERGPYMPGQYHTAVPVLEGAEFLRWWPDEIDGIEPIDAGDATARRPNGSSGMCHKVPRIESGYAMRGADQMCKAPVEGKSATSVLRKTRRAQTGGVSLRS